MDKKNIIVLGAGFGGLQAAITLGKKIKKDGLLDRYEIHVIDRNTYHTFTPLLYEIATTSETSANTPLLRSLVTYSLHEIVAPYGIHVLTDEIKHVDFDEMAVHLSNTKIPFAYLIVALGSESNFFGIPGLKENSLPLKTFANAIAIRNRIAELVRARHHDIRIVVGGGGSTGVELAGEIKSWIPELDKECGADCDAQVTIVEAGPLVLGALDPRVQKAAAGRLGKLGVAMRVNAKIEKVDGDAVKMTDGTVLPYDLLIWTGGVKPSAAAEAWPMEKEPRGRLQVGTAMICKTVSDLRIGERVYAIGDIACFVDPKTGKPLPPMARPAMMEGRIAAENIVAQIKKEEGLAKEKVLKNYQPWNYPYLVPVGGKYAVAKIGPYVIKGLLAWLFKGFVEFNYLLSIMSPAQAFTIWFRGFRVFTKNDRLG